MSSGKHHIPVVVFEVTDACNQRCLFCYNHWKRPGCTVAPPSPDSRLARRTLRRLLRQCSVGSISLSGGEPTLMPGIHDLALKARFGGANVNLLTNGTLLGEDDVEIMSHIGVAAVQIPVMATDPAVHDHITGLPGSWAKAVRSAKMISSDRSGWLIPVLIVSRLNAKYVEDTLRFYASEFGAATAMVNRFNIGGLGLQHASELCLSGEELRDVFSRIDKVAGELGMTLLSGVCTPICVLDPNEYPNIRFSHCTTDLSSRPLTVSYKGEVRFCNHSPRVLGNIYEKPIGDIVAESQADGYFHSVPEHCKECVLWSRCRGGCRAASEQLYGTFGRVDPVLEDC